MTAMKTPPFPAITAAAPLPIFLSRAVARAHRPYSSGWPVAQPIVQSTAACPRNRVLQQSSAVVSCARFDANTRCSSGRGGGRGAISVGNAQSSSSSARGSQLLRGLKQGGRRARGTAARVAAMAGGGRSGQRANDVQVSEGVIG